jgi:hypothetical protein
VDNLKGVIMEKRERRIVERLKGIGRIKKGNNVVAEVAYSILVSKDVIIIDNFDGHQEVDGIGQINGSFRIVIAENNLNQDEVYTLRPVAQTSRINCKDSDIMCNKCS